MSNDKKFELSDLTKDRGALIPLRDDLGEKDRLDEAIKGMANLVSSTKMEYNLARQKLTRGLLLADPNFTREEAERVASRFLNKVIKSGAICTQYWRPKMKIKDMSKEQIETVCYKLLAKSVQYSKQLNRANELYKQCGDQLIEANRQIETHDAEIARVTAVLDKANAAVGKAITVSKENTDLREKIEYLQGRNTVLAGECQHWQAEAKALRQLANSEKESWQAAEEQVITERNEARKWKKLYLDTKFEYEAEVDKNKRQAQIILKIGALLP